MREFLNGRYFLLGPFPFEIFEDRNMKKMIDVIDIDVKDMSKSKTEKGHALIIDAIENLAHLNTPHKFDLERWVEAIICSMQTARESRLSLTKSGRNITKLIW